MGELQIPPKKFSQKQVFGLRKTTSFFQNQEQSPLLWEVILHVRYFTPNLSMKPWILSQNLNLKVYLGKMPQNIVAHKGLKCPSSLKDISLDWLIRSRRFPLDTYLIGLLHLFVYLLHS